MHAGAQDRSAYLTTKLLWQQPSPAQHSSAPAGDLDGCLVTLHLTDGLELVDNITLLYMCMCVCSGNTSISMQERQGCTVVLVWLFPQTE